MTYDARTTIVVVGGGVTGLVAARALGAGGARRARVVLVEESTRLGGKIRTDEVDGIQVEAGADSFVTTPPAALELCASLGLSHELVQPAAFGARLWADGRLRRLPQGFPLGIPIKPLHALTAGALSPAGALRAAADLVLPGTLGDDDVAIGEYVRRRVGDQALRRLVDPVLAGTRAGRAEEMSLQAAAPQIYAASRGRRSLILALRGAARRGELPSGPPDFRAPRGGMERLVARLARDLSDVEVLTGRRVHAVARAGKRYRVDGAPGGLEADGVLLCVPAFEAARLLGELNEDAARILADIRYAAVALAILVYPPGTLSPPEGSGMLVSASEERTLSGCTWYSVKWPHTAPPDGSLVVRCFVGRARRHPALDLDDDALVKLLAAELREAVSFDSRPRAFKVVRWENALAQYDVGHRDRLRRARALLASDPAIELAGGGYEGSGIPDCIRQGEEAAERVLASSRRTPIS